jgi:hypothetical protein
MAPLLILAACSAHGSEKESGASGQNGRRDYQVGAFDRIDVAGSQNVIVTVGGAPSAYAEGDTGLLDRLEVKVENGVLRIGHKKGSWMSFGSRKSKIIVHVSAPSIRGADISGSGDMRIDKVQADSFDGSIAGSGELDIASLKAKATSFSIAGSGGVSAAGTAETADIDIAGSGDVRLSGLEVRRAKVSIAGSGNVEARAMETADVDIMGSGDVVITGPAKCNVSKMGSGDARCGG